MEGRQEVKKLTRNHFRRKEHKEYYLLVESKIKLKDFLDKKQELKNLIQQKRKQKCRDKNGAAIAQWIRLRLPYCGPGFESQAHQLCFNSQILYYICRFIEKRTKINKKSPGQAHILKNAEIDLET